MRSKLSDNIRSFRKERKMTQEQLAEAVGVSAGAVHKWESGRSVPELGLILEMAELFRTSTDALLGYEWKSSGEAAALDAIETPAGEKNYGEAARAAEKALKNFPNSFAVVYRAARLYLELGENGVAEADRRAIELLDRACELIGQNRGDTVSEVSIRTQMAKAHLRLGGADTALRILKKYNVCGVNNAFIGMVLGDFLHDGDGAEKYLGRAFASFAEEIDNIMVGYANVFFMRGDLDTAIDCFQWLRVVLRGIQPEDKLTWFDRYDCILLETVSEFYCLKGELEAARKALLHAIKKASRFDSAAEGEISDMEFFTKLGLEHQPSYGEYGKTAMEGLQRRIEMESTAVPNLGQLWAEVTGGAF